MLQVLQYKRFYIILNFQLFNRLFISAWISFCLLRCLICLYTVNYGSLLLRWTEQLTHKMVSPVPPTVKRVNGGHWWTSPPTHPIIPASVHHNCILNAAVTKLHLCGPASSGLSLLKSIALPSSADLFKL